MNDTPERLRSIDSLRRVRDGVDPQQVADLLAAQGREIQQLRRALEDALDDAEQARNALRSELAGQHPATGEAPTDRLSSQNKAGRSAGFGDHNSYPGSR
jgi:hypothetical protein